MLQLNFNLAYGRHSYYSVSNKKNLPASHVFLSCLVLVRKIYLTIFFPSFSLALSFAFSSISWRSAKSCGIMKWDIIIPTFMINQTFIPTYCLNPLIVNFSFPFFVVFFILIVCMCVCWITFLSHYVKFFSCYSNKTIAHFSFAFRANVCMLFSWYFAKLILKSW